jgi:hypothetical protein
MYLIALHGLSNGHAMRLFPGNRIKPTLDGEMDRQKITLGLPEMAIFAAWRGI